MGRSMYQFAKRTKEKERQQKQVEKNLKRTLAKQQQEGTAEDTAPASAKEPERIKEDE